MSNLNPLSRSDLEDDGFTVADMCDPARFTGNRAAPQRDRRARERIFERQRKGERAKAIREGWSEDERRAHDEKLAEEIASFLAAREADEERRAA